MTETPHRNSLISIGSPHSDDQAGWAVADVMIQRWGATLDVRKAEVPINIMNWIDGVRDLHIVDACLGEHGVGHLYRGEWPTSWQNDGIFLHSTGSHDFDVPAVLRLAERLRRLPAHVVIWGIQGDTFAPFGSITPAVAARLPKIVETIAAELLPHA